MSHEKVHESKHYDYKYLKSLIAGGIAGMASKTLIAPIDRIKILFQTSTKKFTYQEGIREAISLYKTQGFQALWKGNVATLIRVFPYTATQFAVFDFFQAALHHPNHTHIQRNSYNFIAGSIAGICATTLMYPTEFVRTRMAMEKEKHINKSIIETVRVVYRKEGIKAFSHGIAPSLIGIIPYHGTGFFMYHYLKNELREKHPSWSQSKLSDFAFGAFGGIVAQLVSFPFDVVRKKMQAQNVLLQRGEITHKMGVIEWTRHVLKTEGMRGLYKGVTMHFFKAPLANGSCFAIKNMLNRKIDTNYKL